MTLPDFDASLPDPAASRRFRKQQLFFHDGNPEKYGNEAPWRRNAA